jgi:hypothetical protein
MSVIPHHRHTGVFFAADRRALAILVEFCERGRDYAIKSVLLPRRRGVLIALKAAFQVTRFESYFLPRYRSLLAELVRTSDANSFARHGLVMPVARPSAQHR